MEAGKGRELSEANLDRIQESIWVPGDNSGKLWEESVLKKEMGEMERDDEKRKKGKTGRKTKKD